MRHIFGINDAYDSTTPANVNSIMYTTGASAIIDIKDEEYLYESVIQGVGYGGGYS